MRMAIGLVLVTSACGSGAQASPAQVSVAALTQRITPAVDAPPKACPIPYDPTTAAKAGGIGGPVTPADDPVEAMTSDSAGATDFVRKAAPAVTLECDYRLGQADLTTYLFASGTSGSAVTGALPEVAFLSGDTDLSDYVTQAMAAAPGKAVPVSNGGAALVRLNVENGDGVLVVGIDPGDGISADQLSTLTETLAAQVS